MIATLLKIKKTPSRYGGYFYYAFFKGNDSKAYYTCLYPKMRNYIRWGKVLKEGTVFKNLKIKKGNLIDADSKFIIVKEDK